MLRMSATKNPTERATRATAWRLRLDVFDERTEALGAVTDSDKARLVGVNRSTMWRWRAGRMTLELERAMRLAEQLDVPWTELVERPAA